jgi:hypothetical protein
LLTAALPPAATPEFDALEPLAGESGLDALVRVGGGIVAEVGGSDARDKRKDKKLPRQLAALVALRAQGFDNKEIADKLQVSQRRLKSLIATARTEYGWSDLESKLIDVAVPLAMESFISHIEYEGSKAGVALGRNAMTKAALGGVGMLKSHTAAKQEIKSETLNVLRVEITLPQMPPGSQSPLLADGSVLATPRRALVSAEVPPAASNTVDGEVL